MSFPRYSAYKDSGVEWLGEVPQGWEVRKISHFFKAQKGNEAAQLTKEFCATIDGDYPVYSGQTENNGVMARINRYEFDSGENGFLFSTTVGAKAMSVMHLTGKFSLSQNCMIIIPKKPKEYVRFFYYHFQPLFQYERGLIPEHMQASFRMEDLYQYKIMIPPIQEQTNIAAFLDCETAKIDNLINEQKKLIELLKEKRQAVISTAVTKGLNPHAPMKDCGVEWLGEVPEHWEVGAIKRFFTVLDSKRIPLSSEERSYRNGTYPYYGASGVIDWIDDYIFDEDLVLVSEDGANLLTRSTPIAFIATGTYWVNNHAHILKPIDTNLIFWSERIESIDLTPFITGSAQPKLTIDALANIMIAVPPSYEERYAIQLLISQETAKIDNLIQQAQKATTLLQERRTALISAAVTGKIDVRNKSLPTSL